MDRSRPKYRLILVVHDALLLEMARTIGAEYVPGSFAQAVRDLDVSDEDDAWWEMQGEFGRFRVRIERHEGYLSCSLWAQEPQLQAGEELMWRRYITSGGNPDAARKP